MTLQVFYNSFSPPNRPIWWYFSYFYHGNLAGILMVKPRNVLGVPVHSHASKSTSSNSSRSPFKGPTSLYSRSRTFAPGKKFQLWLWIYLWRLVLCPTRVTDVSLSSFFILILWRGVPVSKIFTCERWKLKPPIDYKFNIKILEKLL